MTLLDTNVKICRLWLELLRRTLGRVLGRVLGRQVVGDKEETPQRRMPTAYARRQRATAGVTGDVNHVDHAANEVHIRSLRSQLRVM